MENKYIDDMIQWALDNNLYTEFCKEILHDKHYSIWLMNNALVRRFGYFVLEHMKP